jgi:hypothetical protein
VTPKANGVYRLIEDYSATAQYSLCTFQYTIESDERSIGFFTLAVNASSSSLAPQPETLVRTLQEAIEDDPAFEFPRDRFTKIAPAVETASRREARAMIGAFELSANRRLARDRERVDAYYRSLLPQIKKRMTRKSTDPGCQRGPEPRGSNRTGPRRKTGGLAPEILAARATILRRYHRVGSASARNICSLNPQERAAPANPSLEFECAAPGTIPVREARGAAHPVYLCDDKVHTLSKECLAQCPRCGRVFCKVCQPRCKCGGSNKV